MLSNSRGGTLWLIGLMLLISGIVAAKWYYRPSYMDATRSVATAVLPVPQGDYLDVIWLTADEFVFLYSDGTVQGLWDYRITVYNRRSDEWHEFPVPEEEGCVSAWAVRLERLPNETIGYIHRCNLDLSTSHERLFSLNPVTLQTSVLFTYPENFHPSDYAFAPDMTRFLQAVTGGMSSNEIYLIDRAGEISQLFQHYDRVASPAWAPDGESISYVGNEDAIEEAQYPWSYFMRGRATLLAPWDLYIARSDGTNALRVLRGLQLPGGLAWSPDGSKLACACIYDGESGIWVFDVQAQALSRIWPASVNYTWSPIADEIVVLDRVAEEFGLTTPKVVQLP